MPGAGSDILKTWNRQAPGLRRMRRRGRALPEHRRRPRSSRAGRRCRLRARAGRTHRGPTPGSALRPGEFYLRELPPLRAVLEDLSELGLLVVDGYADLDPAGRPGLGARTHAEFGIPVIGVAKSKFRTATHAVPVVRGSSGRPLFVTAAGMPAADAADLVRRMAGRYRLPDALRRADTLARTGPPAATMTDRQPD
jgi:deoxyribonuclease V